MGTYWVIDVAFIRLLIGLVIVIFASFKLTQEIFQTWHSRNELKDFSSLAGYRQGVYLLNAGFLSRFSSFARARTTSRNDQEVIGQSDRAQSVGLVVGAKYGIVIALAAYRQAIALWISYQLISPQVCTYFASPCFTRSMMSGGNSTRQYCGGSLYPSRSGSENLR